MPPELVIFDLDGTLADTLGDIEAAMNRALLERGLPLRGRDEYRRFVGDGVDWLARRVLPAAEQHRVDELVEAFRMHYEGHLLDGTRAFAGIPELLADLAAAGIPMAVLSNKPHPATVSVVSGLFPNTEFVAVHGVKPSLPPKPDPTSALAIAAAAGVLPERCSFVGDSDVDVETALRAGMRPIAVLWGLRSEAELLGAGATQLVAAPAELMALLRS